MNRPKGPADQKQQFLDELQVALNRRRQLEGVPVIIPKREQQQPKSVPWTPKLNHVPLPVPKPVSAPQTPWIKPKDQARWAQKPEQKTQRLEITISEEQRRIDEEIQNIDREARKLAQVIQGHAKEHHAEEIHPESEFHSEHELTRNQTQEGKMEADLPPPPCYEEPPLPPVLPELPPLEAPPVLPQLPPILELPPANVYTNDEPKLRVEKSWRHTISEINTDHLKPHLEIKEHQHHENVTEKKKKRHSMSEVRHVGQKIGESPATEKKKKGIKKFVNLISKVF